jgi:NAD(P)-dependent dehydrogenase (short-subunit alcohol dehydrogenase family)
VCGGSARRRTLILDVSSPTLIDQAFDTLSAPIDILINNAGIEEICPALDVDEARWDRILGTNLKGAFFCARRAARLMPRGSAILNLCSLTAEVGIPTAVPYGASKSGMAGITRALAAEWAAAGIRVNGIGPGYFHTDMTEVFYDNETWRRDMLEKIPMRRFGELPDLAGAAIFLCSPAAAYITGQILYIDGGLLASI